MELSWQSPDTECPITEYNIHLEGDILWSVDVVSNTLIIESSKNCIDEIRTDHHCTYGIDNLIPYTKYYITIFALSHDTEGDISSVETQTKADGKSVLFD